MSPFGTVTSGGYGESKVCSRRLVEAAAAQRLEDRLRRLLGALAASGTPPRLIDAMRLARLAGGKRLRPFLVMDCASLFGVPVGSTLAGAGA
jgi:farnesyl diphosphate synthase